MPPMSRICATSGRRPSTSTVSSRWAGGDAILLLTEPPRLSAVRDQGQRAGPGPQLRRHGPDRRPAQRRERHRLADPGLLHPVLQHRLGDGVGQRLGGVPRLQPHQRGSAQDCRRPGALALSVDHHQRVLPGFVDAHVLAGVVATLKRHQLPKAVHQQEPVHPDRVRRRRLPVRPRHRAEQVQDQRRHHRHPVRPGRRLAEPAGLRAAAQGVYHRSRPVLHRPRCAAATDRPADRHQAGRGAV